MQGPKSWESLLLLPRRVWILLPLFVLWNCTTHKSYPQHISWSHLPSAVAYTLVWGVWSLGCSCLLRWPCLCSDFSLNKSTSYPSLCLSLDSFCDETSRTWASLSPETRCVISVGIPCVPIWILAGFKSQSELHGFRHTSLRTQLLSPQEFCHFGFKMIFC